MAVDTFPTQFDKMTTTKDRFEARTLTVKMTLNLALATLFCAILHTFYLMWAIVKIVWSLSYALFFGLGAIISRLRLAVHRRRIAKALLKQYNV